MHRNKYVNCRTCFIYRIQLSCGKSFIRQTGRCNNEILRDQSNKLSTHRDKCGSVPGFKDTDIIGRSKNELCRLVIESAHMEEFDDACVSKSSLSLLWELELL